MVDDSVTLPNLVPRPDPTLLTTQQLNAAVMGLQTQFQRDVASLERIITVRLDGMQQATELLQAAADKMPSEVDIKVAHLQNLHAERFNSIALQFAERDTRIEQSSKDSKTAVDAALQAAKEAVGAQTEASERAIAKSETATAKQIDQQGTLISTATKALDDKIGDLKERLTLIEGKAVGNVSAGAAHQTGNSFMLALFVAGISLAGLVLLVIRDFSR